MGGAYPEIATGHRRIAEAVEAEEARFAQTLDRGLALLEGEVETARRAGRTVLAGDVAFVIDW